MKMFNLNDEITSTYENKDIYASKFKFFRMKYLIEKEKYNIGKVELISGKLYMF